MTTSGEVRGTEQDGVRRFRNIRYATPPVGERRRQPPQPARCPRRKPHHGVLTDRR
ncbi:hypothetical protein DMB42_45215 [Nonomuraea sp. WAC 01424]|uniref:carboxylesterase family protein n=1 Tax=Nonomuraea sp. WAC 01424 TaxID=2203200 RepID=UPI000F786126|nr:hypothetical protein DMB42_45215 [Nonomuraea sp. WAC 01424]